MASAVDRPAVSVVIPVFNGADVIATQVRAVFRQLLGGDEIVVANNRSTDRTRETLRSLEAEIPYLRTVEAPERPGVNYARNTGIQASRNPYILLCDADDRVGHGWVDAMTAGLGLHDLVGGTSLVCGVDGIVTDEIRLGSIFNYLPYAIGCNLGARRTVFEQVGGFDESFVSGHDEVEFAWRAQQAGFTLGFAEGAVIEYVQRSDPQATARQYRNYGRTSIQLWTRFRGDVPAGQISLRGAVLSVVSNVRTGAKVARGAASLPESRAWGWSVGVLEGHLKYRILRRIPQPRIPAVELPREDELTVQEPA